jgi:hypothetical protein
VADYHSHPLIRMIIWRNLLDPYAAMDRPAAICDISYLLTDRTALQYLFQIVIKSYLTDKFVVYHDVIKLLS